eukprot:CAMPEP_0185731754 /NCGR_PEP_ID=MMETSP1171-20130828/13904_1 /TAXON_ID=374046 /ORGANISM="Helicotheca tamensis, Strain CCMP826" /LENGTH=409 /DNA_ID=CAMNT_0028401079 /DNA_START=279 /DNA_END=1508 /DNA_ORIENTATION=-
MAADVTNKMYNGKTVATFAEGSAVPILKEFWPTKSKANAIVKSLSANNLLNFWEVFITIMMGWCLLPMTDFITFNILQKEKDNKSVGRKGVAHPMIKTISNYFKIDAYVYLADVIAVASDTLGFKALKKFRFPLIVSKVGRTLWAMKILKSLKNSFLKAAFQKMEADQEVLTLYDRITNVLLYFITAAILVDFLSLHIGIAVSSLLSLGGLSTIIFSLASKNVAEQLISGISLSTSGRFDKGDVIQLGDGTCGTVHRMTLTHMEIRQSDESIIVIPNNQVFQQRVMNLGKIQRNQVMQTLWFKYDDIDKMPLVTKKIKEEIMESCPKLIKINRPFRVHWRNIGRDHLEVVVDCRFNIPFVGDENFDNRQQVLEAIWRAVKQCGMKFSLPTYSVESDRPFSDEFVPEKNG